jgi:hypothetical protein
MQAMTGGDHDGSGLGMNTILATTLSGQAMSAEQFAWLCGPLPEFNPNKVRDKDGEAKEDAGPAAGE